MTERYCGQGFEADRRYCGLLPFSTGSFDNPLDLHRRPNGNTHRLTAPAIRCLIRSITLYTNGYSGKSKSSSRTSLHLSSIHPAPVRINARYSTRFDEKDPG